MFSLIPLVSQALGPNCAAPGALMLTDPSGDQVGRSDVDIQAVSISEASSTTRNLVFTVKTGASQTPITPNGRWIVTFKANTPATDYYVAMVTSPEANGGQPSFYYGTGANGFGGTDVLGGGLDGSKYDAATGTITVVAPNVDFKINPNDNITTVAAKVQLSGGACGVACLNGASADAAAASAAIYTAGGACGTLQTIVGGSNNSTPSSIFGGADVAKPADPRFQVFAPPAGIGADGSAGEYSIGFNPKTKRFMVNSLGFSVGPVAVELFSAKVFRVTPPEQITPATPLAESCDALWEDKSNLYNNLPMVLSDPILWTDQDTGRTFSADLTTGPNPTSQYAYTDTDGDSWIPVGAGLAGADHQTITAGFYPAGSPFEQLARNIGYGQKDASGKVVKGKAVYFCSQDLVPGTCVRSDDGGNSYSPPQVAYDGTLCSNLHGHLKVAPDGTAYLPIKGCGNKQGGTFTTDAGLTWKQFTVPDTRPQTNGSDPSFAIDDANTLYYCYVNGDGHPHVRIGTRTGSTLNWTTDTDLGSAHGIVNAVFPEAMGGDAGRAACGFLGTNAPGPNYESKDFPGVWYLYIATTTDGGMSWTTANATPGDPVQGVGGIWQQGGSGDTNNNRNLLDFNEVTLDDKGRVIFGYNDGCVGACDTDPVGSVTYVASMRVVRQTGGKSLRAAFDNLGTARAPGAACLAAADAGTNVSLSWKRPDHGGSALRFDIEQVYTNGSSTTVGTTTGTAFSVPAKSLATSAYLVRAVNGTSGTPSVTRGTPSVAPVINRAPTSSLSVTPTTITGSTAGTTVNFTVTMTDADGDSLRYDLDFGDNTSHAPGTAGGVVAHNYTGTQARTYTAVLKVVETSTTPPLAAADAMTTVRQDPAPGGGTGPAITINGFTATPSTGDVTNVPLNVTFTVDASDTAADKGVVSYTYYYGDGTHSARLSTPTDSHSYSKVGKYQASVIVADDAANSATAETPITTTSTVTINPSAPVTAVLSASFPNGALVPATAVLDGSGSTSNEGSVYRFSFGDGTAVQSGTSKTAQHVYTIAGVYTVTLTVTDKDDPSNKSTATASVAVTAVQQTVAQLSISPSSTTVGKQVMFDASATIAKTGTTISRYVFDFGDGTPPQDGTSATASHAYTRSGSFSPSVTVTDSSSGTSSSKALVNVDGPADSTTGTVTATTPHTGGALPLWTLLPLLLAGLRRRRR